MSQGKAMGHDRAARALYRSERLAKGASVLAEQDPATTPAPCVYSLRQMAYRVGSSMYSGVLACTSMYRTLWGGAADSEGLALDIGFESSKTSILGPGGWETGWSSGTSAELAVLEVPVRSVGARTSLAP